LKSLTTSLKVAESAGDGGFKRIHHVNSGQKSGENREKIPSLPLSHV
jgi:hypothetical protein